MVKRGLRKTFRKPTQRKRPITLDVMLKLLHGLDRRDLTILQYCTMMMVAHDACLRTKELLALRWSDVVWVGTPSAITGVKLRIRVSKARHTEAAETLELTSYMLGEQALSGVHLLWTYMNDARSQARTRGGDKESFLFPNARTGDGEMPRNTFVSWVQTQLSRAGYDSSEFGGHSFRAGGATDLHAGKAPEAIVRMLGRWRSRETYLIYIRLDPSKRAADVSKAYSDAYTSACASGRINPDTYYEEYEAAYRSSR